MFNLFHKNTEDFISPVSGTLLPIEQVDDPVFSQRMMGDGFAIIPTEKTVFAPCSGVVSVCFPTKHAVGLKAADGKEFLLHIGINTVELKGKGFTSLVTQGQTVKQGDPLVDVDLDELKNLGYDPTVIVIFPEVMVDVQMDMKSMKHHQALPITFSKKR